MKALTLLVIALLIPVLGAASLSCETPSGATVTVTSGLSKYELWRSTYNWGEIKAAMSGGMKLHGYMHERGLDWVVLTVTPANVYWTKETCITLMLKDGRRLGSIELVCTDSPLERKLFHVRDGVQLDDPRLARVGSGGVLMMAGFPAGSLIVAHHDYWADLADVTRMEVRE